MDDTKKLIEKYKRELMELSAASQKRKAEQSSETGNTPVSPVKTPKIIGYVDEDNTAYGDFLAELSKTSADNITNAASAEPESQTAQPDEEGCGTAENTVSAGSDSIADADPAPDTVNEPEIIVKPDGEIDEIIDESEPLFAPPRYSEIPSTEQVRENITENAELSNDLPEKNVSGITDNSATAPRPEAADTLTVSKEKAERLNDQPVSGTDPNEQLTGRSFEEPAPPPDTNISMEQGSRAEPIQYPETNYGSYDEFIKANSGTGSLVFRVYTGQEAVLIEGAECVITKKINGSSYTIARLFTDSNGQTPVQELPAPPKELSQHAENSIRPFALYDATVTKPGFVRVTLKDIPVFDGVQSVQRVFMIVDG